MRAMRCVWLDACMSGMPTYRVLLDVAPPILGEVLEHQLGRADLSVARRTLLDPSQNDLQYDVEIVTVGSPDSSTGAILEMTASGQSFELDLRDVASVRRVLELLCPARAR